MIAWGVDPGAWGFAVAAIDVETGELLHAARHEVLDPGTDEQRVRGIAVLGHRVFEALAADHPPDIAAVELPIGPQRVPKLMAGWGAITVPAVGVAGAATVWLVPSQWRSLAGTNRYRAEGAAIVAPLGLAKSNPLSKWTKNSALAQARAHGYGGRQVDEADAVCIAIAGGAKLLA